MCMLQKNNFFVMCTLQNVCFYDYSNNQKM